MKAVPVRIPEAWSAAWFRVFYNEVLAKQQEAGASPDLSRYLTARELEIALADHNVNPATHSAALAAHGEAYDPHRAYARRAAAESHAFFLGG